MRYSQLFIPTQKEVPAEAQVASHVLMLRAGMIRKLAAGVYTYLPLGQRVFAKVARIVREEMDRAGCQEIVMPAVQPKELWERSGRWAHYGPELLRLRDRKGGEFCFGPTHEEVVTDLVAGELRSFRDLPLNLYQIQTKFRDEVRPRFGLMRGREFVMKDGYSFDRDEAAAMVSYRAMYDAYVRIFTRCGLSFRPVEADTGAIGGSRSHEFQVLAESGEDLILACDRCEYAANVEKAELAPTEGGQPELPAGRPCREVHTPDRRTIDEVAGFLGITPERLVKTLIYMDGDGTPYAALVRGDRDVNPVKLAGALGTGALFLATDDVVRAATRAEPGFAGPVGLSGLPLIADREVERMADFAVGANRDHHHLVDVCCGRDFTPSKVADIRTAVEGDRCPRCGTGSYRQFRGIEVGQVFYLGTKYSQPMGCRFLDEHGVERPAVMGCYGIGVTRTAAAAIEQHHDPDGIVWPMPIAPFQVILTPLIGKGSNDELHAAERLHAELEAAGIETVLDDREERPGSKFKDADLLGIPIRVTIGARNLKEGRVEIKLRRLKEAELVPLAGAAARVRELVALELAACAP